MSNEIALRARLSEAINEYNYKSAALEEELALFEAAGDRLKSAVTIMGQFGRENIDVGRAYIHNLKNALTTSAWLALYEKLSLKTLMSANDKRRFEQSLSQAVEFNIENIKATFGSFILDPRGNILRGLAEVFCGLDQSYKSHDKVKIGVAGLPKRVILSGFNCYSSMGREKIRDILNALAAYQGKPAVEWSELSDIEKNGDALRESRGVWLKLFGNGNGHLFFDKQTLKDINAALSEFYGDVLADCADDKPTQRQTSTAVSKDLQYYPTPKDVVERILANLYIDEGALVLEPSCGCGRILDGVRAHQRTAKLWGIEIDPSRALEAKQKGHNVLVGNFLETVPEPRFDHVIMNPPFYGKHYEKHIRHAIKFLKKDGVLTAILPITAKLDHGLLDDLNGRWDDLPIGSFSESGTNVNTTIFTYVNR